MSPEPVLVFNQCIVCLMDESQPDLDGGQANRFGNGEGFIGRETGATLKGLRICNPLKYMVATGRLELPPLG